MVWPKLLYIITSTVCAPTSSTYSMSSAGTGKTFISSVCCALLTDRYGVVVLTGLFGWVTGSVGSNVIVKFEPLTLKNTLLSPFTLIRAVEVVAMLGTVTLAL